MCALTDNQITPFQVVNYENQMMKNFGFNISFPTIFDSLSYFMVELFAIENSENFVFVEKLAGTFLLMCIHNPIFYCEDLSLMIPAAILKAVDYMFSKLLEKDKYKNSL